MGCVPKAVQHQHDVDQENPENQASDDTRALAFFDARHVSKPKREPWKWNVDKQTCLEERRRRSDTHLAGFCRCVVNSHIRLTNSCNSLWQFLGQPMSPLPHVILYHTRVIICIYEEPGPGLLVWAAPTACDELQNKTRKDREATTQASEKKKNASSCVLSNQNTEPPCLHCKHVYGP